MIIKELMIGDFVQYNDMACKVYCIGAPFERKNEKFNNQYIATLWCNGFIDAIADEIKPIPLTEDILKANGFMNPYGYSSVYFPPERHDVYVEINDSGWGVLSFQDHNDECYPLISVQFVHELQHALRLCRLNELEDNFKIKAMEE